MQIDMRTALLLMSISSLVYGLLLAAVWAVRRREIALAFWSVASLCAAGGSLLYVLRGTIPDLLSIATGNMLMLLSGTVRWAGLRRFEGLHTPAWQYLSAPLILFGVAAFTEPLGLTAAHRTVIILLAAVLFNGLILRDSLRAYGAEPMVTRKMLIASIGLIIVLDVVQLAVVWLQQPRADLSFTAWQGWYPMVMLVFFSTYALVNLSSFVMLFERHESRLLRAASIDALTGLLNRAGFTQLADRQRQRSVRDGKPLSVLVMDLDWFKSINDRYGHDAGDAVLNAFAQTARAALRPTDLLSRPGGEEFWALLPETDLADARLIAQRVCDQFRGSSLRFSGAEISCTVSLGAAEVLLPDESLQAALGRADQALYEAKHAGRNRVAVAALPTMPGDRLYST